MRFVSRPFSKIVSSPLLVNSLLSLIARFTGVALNFAVILIITNKLPKTDAGDLMLLMHFVTGVALISRLGIDQLLIKEVASAHDSHTTFRHQFLARSYQAVLILSLFFMVLWLLASPFIRNHFFDNGTTHTIKTADLMLASLGILFFNLVILNSTFLKAVKQTVYGVLSQNALPAITFLLLIAIFWNSFAKNQNYFNLYTASLVLAGISAIWITRRSLSTANSAGKAINSPPLPAYSEIIKRSLPLAPVSIISFLMIFSDAIMVGLFLPNDKVADYSVAAKISFVTLFFLQAMEATIYPRLLNIFHHKGHQLVSFFWQSSALVVMVVFSVTLFLYLVSDWLLYAFGKEYIVAKSVLGLLLMAQFFRAASLTFSFMFIIQEKVRYLNFVLLTALLINLASNVILIPLYGIVGAASATLFANGTLLTLVLLLFYSKHLLNKPSLATQQQTGDKST